MSTTSLFRSYAVAWLFAALSAAAIAASVVPATGWMLAGYAAVAVALWVADKVFVVRRRTQTEHVLAHDITTAAAAIVWPLVLVGLLVFLLAAVVAGLREA